MKKTFLTKEQVEDHIRLHILKGDTGDGIPNVLSEDDCFVMGVRQKKLTEKRINELSDPLNVDIDTDTKRRIERNRMLIDMSFIPENVERSIIDTYNNECGKTRQKMFDYFVKHKLRLLLEDIGDF